MNKEFDNSKTILIKLYLINNRFFGIVNYCYINGKKSDSLFKTSLTAKPQRRLVFALFLNRQRGFVVEVQKHFGRFKLPTN